MLRSPVENNMDTSQGYSAAATLSPPQPTLAISKPSNSTLNSVKSEACHDDTAKGKNIYSSATPRSKGFVEKRRASLDTSPVTPTSTLLKDTKSGNGDGTTRNRNYNDLGNLLSNSF